MARRLLAVFFVASLALALAFATLWVRSFWAVDRWIISLDLPRGDLHDGVTIDSLSSRGTAEFLIEAGTWPGPDQIGSRFEHITQPPAALIFQSFDRTFAERLGLRWVNAGIPTWQGVAAQRGTRTLIDLPDWSLAGGAMLLPAFWFVTRFRSRRSGRGFQPVGTSDARSQLTEQKIEDRGGGEAIG